MLQQQHPSSEPVRLPPRKRHDHDDVLMAAPSGGDPGIPAGLPTGSGGGADIPPEALRPQRVKPVTIVIVLALVALAAVVVWLAIRTEATKMTDLERIETQKNIFVLPEKDQIPKWRAWAGKKDADVDLRSEALMQLALLGDDEGIKLAIEALKARSHALRGSCAQVLAHYGTPKADAGKPALLEALKKADESDRRQIVWALVELKEVSIFNTAMDLYASGELTTVQRLEGGGAFDPVKVAKLVSLDDLSKRVTDESAAIRQLVATILSENAEPKFADALIVLVQDKEIVVAREAAPGLGKIGDAKARKPLIEALRNADKDNRLKFLQALRDGIGGEGLVLSLDTVVKEPEATNWFQMRQLFDMMHMLADPRIGDSLVAWVEKNKPHTHWETEAGVVLAEVGDIRAGKYLGKRMGIENKDIYIKEKFWQADAGGHLTRTDRPRVIGARMLADLARLHEGNAEQLREWAEEPVLDWMTTRPQPHANGLRFLAAVGAKGKAVEIMRDWAFPAAELPAEGAQPPFPRDYETAQSALRYIGWMKDKESYDKLLDQFDRKKDKKMDITQAGLEGAGLAMLGMALRAVTYGASQGLAQYGPVDDDRATKKMLEFIEDKTWHEEAREAACGALAWIADDKTLETVAEKVAEYASKEDPKDQFIGACFAVTLTRKPVPSATAKMIELLTPSLEPTIRNYLGRAIGVAGIEGKPELEKALFEKLKDPELRNPAALALIMGGSKSTAARTVATYSGKDDAIVLNDLKDHWYRAFGYWSDEDLTKGNLYRYVRNAEAIARIKIGDAPQLWANHRLRAQFDNLQFDNGPHSETRVVLRARLHRAAKEGDAALKQNAVMTLRFMKEQGVLMALKDEKGETATIAAKALHRLMNPRLTVTDNIKHLEEEEKSN